MKLARFQLALNHDDPKITIQGLQEFKDKILLEHNAIESFGYNGRSLSSYQKLEFSSSSSLEIKGLLKEYLLSSPYLEELFILWKIPDRNENPDLIVAHTQCLAAILHCAKSDQRSCDRIVSRVLSEFSRAITNQMTSGQQNIIHSTLGLLFMMCSSSSQNCRDTYQKLINHLHPLQTLLQKGKTISVEISGVRLSTDSRHLIVLLILLIFFHCDIMIGNELISQKGFFNRVVNGLHKDTPETVHQILQSSLEILSSSTVPYLMKVNLIDPSYLNKLLELNNEQNLIISKKLLLSYCHLLVESGGGGRREGKVNLPMNRMVLLIKTLSPQIDLFHKEVRFDSMSEHHSMSDLC
jgi:hypothetical protein